MTSSTITGQPTTEGRSVRDIVEHEHDVVDDAWCRKLLRQLLQSLERQYAMEMPHRAITADTVVFHQNGEPLLLSSIVSDPAPGQADDLNALAKLVHYAITQELMPEGPLHGRALEGYSAALKTAVDRCMDPDPSRRPQTIGELRDMLGIVPPGSAPLAPAPAMLADPVAAPSTALPPSLAPAPQPMPAPASAPVVEPTPAPIVEPTPEPTVEPAAVPIPEPIPEPLAEQMPEPRPEPPLPTPPAATSPASPTPAQSLRASTDSPPASAPAPAPQRDPSTPASAAPKKTWPLIAGACIVAAALAAGYIAWRDNSNTEETTVVQPQAEPPAQPQVDSAAPPGPPAAAPADAPVATEPGQPAPATDVRAVAPAAPAGTLSAPPATATTASPAPATQTVQAANPAGASYKLQIQPWGTVYVDGVDRGVSPPIKRLVLSPGRHTVRVTNPNFRERVLDIDTAGGDGRIAIDFSDAAE